MKVIKIISATFIMVLVTLNRKSQSVLILDIPVYQEDGLQMGWERNVLQLYKAAICLQHAYSFLHKVYFVFF